MLLAALIFSSAIQPCPHGYPILCIPNLPQNYRNLCTEMVYPFSSAGKSQPSFGDDDRLVIVHLCRFCFPLSERC